jgi:K+/H+ antiporter YhaU regulatory subunit KhtT
VRRAGIMHREPGPDLRLLEGDIVVLSGLPDHLEHAESRLLMGGR